MKSIFMSSITAGVATMLFAAEPLATSETVVGIALDTYSPCSLKEKSEITLTIGEGETVTAISPTGAETTLESEVWKPNGGGIWTLVNSQEGTAYVTVRHSQFNTLGEGTIESPANIIDDEELTDLAEKKIAEDGYVFRFCGESALLDSMIAIDGFSVTVIGDNLYRLDESDGNALFRSAASTAFFDTEKPGPDRRCRIELKKSESFPVAYSGDLWRMRAPDAQADISAISPSGTTDTKSLTGTGTMALKVTEYGAYTVTLTAGGETKKATLSFLGKGMRVICR